MRLHWAWIVAAFTLGYLASTTLAPGDPRGADPLVAPESAIAPRLLALERQVARLADELGGPLGPVLQGQPHETPRAPDNPRPETGWDRVTSALAALKPTDYRQPLPQEDLRGAAWDSIGLVQKKLRPEDADAWSAWAARRATDQLFQQLPVEVPEGDRSRIAELLDAHYREEARRLIDARPGWEDRSRSQADREGAYAEWLREFRRSAEERDKAIMSLLDRRLGPTWRNDLPLVMPP